jgi:hypothetical protein
MSKKDVLDLIMEVCEKHQIAYGQKDNILEMQVIFNSCVLSIIGICSGANAMDKSENIEVKP